jgi:hypothetical protein
VEEGRKEETVTETLMTPKAFLDMQAKMADALFEAYDESAKQAEAAVRESATQFTNAMHAHAERSIGALSLAAKLRAKTVGIAREAFSAPATATK